MPSLKTQGKAALRPPRPSPRPLSSHLKILPTAESLRHHQVLPSDCRRLALHLLLLGVCAMVATDLHELIQDRLRLGPCTLTLSLIY
jgi:hypothetical protein